MKVPFALVAAAALAVPGAMLHAPAGDFTAANMLAAQLCEGNGTGLVIRSSYGG